jgi:predicted dehydrogenase
MQSNKKFGVALVGLGNYATLQLAPALQQSKRCYLAGVVTGTPEKAAKWKEQYSIPDENIYQYQNFDQIVDNKNIDIVYVVLPNSLHREYVIRAAKAGKHVICEKPMALTVNDCQDMIDACKKAKVKLGIGYRLHSEPLTKEIIRIVQDKEFGKINVVQASFGFCIGDPTQWRLKKALAGGGALMDVGIYAIQAARYCTGEEPISVLASAFKTDNVKFKEVDETVFWNFDFPSGAVASCATSYATNFEYLHVSAEKGEIELQPAFMYGTLKGRTSKGEMKFEPVNQQAAQMDDFAQCIIDDRESSVNGEEGLKDVNILQAIYKSLETGQRVKI